MFNVQCSVELIARSTCYKASENFRYVLIRNQEDIKNVALFEQHKVE